MAKKFNQDRHRSILEIVRGLLLSEVAFQDIFKKYKEGHLRFSDIGDWVDDKGQSLLYDLKEKCQSLFNRWERSRVAKRKRYERRQKSKLPCRSD